MRDGRAWHHDRRLIGLAWFFLGAGGLWHLLGLFQRTMTLLAGPLLILVALLAWGALRASHLPGRRRLHGLDLWAAGVVLTGLAVEWIGVHTGLPFGEYAYGSVLEPSIGPLPLAIGFAWLGTLAGALAVAQRLLPARLRRAPIPLSLATGALMLLFDLLMEPAAMALGYWSWAGGSVPAANYLSWFVLGSLFTFAGTAAGLGKATAPPLAAHLYGAQLLYFALVLPGKVP